MTLNAFKKLASLIMVIGGIAVAVGFMGIITAPWMSDTPSEAKWKHARTASPEYDELWNKTEEERSERGNTKKIWLMENEVSSPLESGWYHGKACSYLWKSSGASWWPSAYPQPE